MNDHPKPPPDPRSPLVIDTGQLPRAPGAMRRLERVVPAPPELGVALLRVPEGSDLHLDLRLESATEGVLVSGEVTGTAVGECGRCLRDVEKVLQVPVRELFAYPDSTTDATAEEDEVGRLRDGLLDLEPVVRDALVLAMPGTPLCRGDCPGLCPGCGAHWDDLPADHQHEERTDPRWAALRTLTVTDRNEE